jgi:effector-binding domain-containing protein
MGYVIESRTLGQQPTAVRRATLSAAEVGSWLADSYSTVAEYLQRGGVTISGPPYARYVFRGNQVDVEAGFPVSRPVSTDGGIEASALPDGTAAITTHYGPYERLEDAYKAVLGWIHDHGFEPAGAHWEVYFTNPIEEADTARWRTDVVAPYATAQRSSREEASDPAGTAEPM